MHSNRLDLLISFNLYSYIIISKSYLFVDPKQVEAVLRMTMNPRNWADSTMSFAVNARGDIYDENSGSYDSYEEKWRPGTYNLSASMQIIKFEEPSPS